MKQLLIIALSAVMMAGCAGKSGQLTAAQVMEQLNAKLQSISADSSMSNDDMRMKSLELIDSTYRQHLNDTVDVDLFLTLATNLWEPSKALSEYESAPELVRSNEKIAVKMQAIANIDKTSVGNSYIDVEGTDALTSDTLKISSFIGEKPLLIDFWASWCGPCRREIQSKLIPLAATGQVNIVGIAVWEDSVEDTQEAMKELGITWPVIYTGGREDSPTVSYGIIGIPTLVLVSPDGTILGRGHSIDEIEYFQQNSSATEE